jgi:hypothetical protein
VKTKTAIICKVQRSILILIVFHLFSARHEMFITSAADLQALYLNSKGMLAKTLSDYRALFFWL